MYEAINGFKNVAAFRVTKNYFIEQKYFMPNKSNQQQVTSKM